MKAVTKKTVLSALREKGPLSFDQLVYLFILSEERHYKRLEQTLHKLLDEDAIAATAFESGLDSILGHWSGSKNALRTSKFSVR